jgi:lipopolysaccharide/colanic/teichoic acid biosynthesis glycosyltransferase
VYKKYGSVDGEKASIDFRVTRWGRTLRKLWIDELPMLINLFMGQIKIVGVRPLSKTKFDTYPKAVQPALLKLFLGGWKKGSIPER